MQARRVLSVHLKQKNLSWFLKIPFYTRCHNAILNLLASRKRQNKAWTVSARPPSTFDFVCTSPPHFSSIPMLKSWRGDGNLAQGVMGKQVKCLSFQHVCSSNVLFLLWCCLRDTFEIISRITNHIQNLPIFCKHCWNSHSSAFGCGLTATSERKASILKSGQGDLAVFDERKQAKKHNNQLQHGMKSLKAFFFCLVFDGIFLTVSGFSKLIPTAAWLDKMEGLFRNWKQCDYRNFRSLNKEGWVFAHFKGRILRGWLGTCVQCRNLQVVVSF